MQDFLPYAFIKKPEGNYGYINGKMKGFDTKHDYAKAINKPQSLIPTAEVGADGSVIADLYFIKEHVRVLFKNFETWQLFANSSVLLKGIFDKDKVFWGCVLIHDRPVLMKFDKGLLQYLAMVKKPFKDVDKVVVGSIIRE